MRRRILYPGPLQANEVILVTGSVHSSVIAAAAESLAQGVRTQGKTATVFVPAVPRAFSQADVAGDPSDITGVYDVLIVDMAQYLGNDDFRHGDLPDLTFTRSVFLTPAAEKDVSLNVTTASESARRQDVIDALTPHLPGPIHLVAPSLVRPSQSDLMLMETIEEVMADLEAGNPVDPDLKAQREIWRSQRTIDCAPRVEAPLWR